MDLSGELSEIMVLVLYNIRKGEKAEILKVNAVKQAWSPSNVWEIMRWCFVGTCVFGGVVCLLLLLGLFCSVFILKLLRLACG